MIGTQAFQDAFENSQHSIFRLERLQHYAGDPNFDRYLAGLPWQDTDSKLHWVDLVQRRTAEGVALQRTHVVEEPWSDFVRFEVTWSYPHNVAAGEDVRVTTSSRVAYELVGDFWMFDDQQVWAMGYDQAGNLIEVVDRSDDASFVAACREAKAVALAASEPLAQVTASL